MQILPLLLATTFAAVAAAQSPLTTVYTGGNGLPGDSAVYFNLTVTVPVLMQQIDVSALGGAGTSAIEFWTAPLTWVGKDANPGAWTQRGSSLGITANPEGTPTPAPLQVPFSLPVGSYGVAIVYRGTFGPSYTIGNGANQTYSRAEMTLSAGASGGIFTGATNNPRVWNGSLHYTPSSPGTVATSTTVGDGCVARPATFYEQFATSPAFDLSNSGLTMEPAISGYTVGALQASYVAPSVSAQVLPLGDDGQTSITLSLPFAYPGGSTTSLVVCSNGFVSTANGNGTNYQPTGQGLLAMPHTVYSCWHDYDPTAPGSGQVKFEEAGGVAFVTWDGVYSYFGAGPGTAPSTFQMQFELASGTVHYVFRTMDLVGGSNYGDTHLIGWSPGSATLDPGSMDLSAALPATFVRDGADLLPLTLAAPRPLVLSTIQLAIDNVPAGSPFGAVLLGLQNPGLNLTALGMPGCFRYTDGLATELFLAPGTSLVVPFVVPNAAGLTITAQAVVLAPQANLTPLGAISSNGVLLLLGNQ
ncbi:MAG: hypothetical protein IT456_21270 [Planctomycetes bacterium]|nr:hypothetical protein [Planctomycetota bacterium]